MQTLINSSDDYEDVRTKGKKEGGETFSREKRLSFSLFPFLIPV